MGEIIVSERERLDLIQQGDHVFLEAQERLYDAKKQRAAPESKDKVVTTLDTFTVYGSLDEVTELYLNDEKKMVLDFSESRELVVLKPNTVQRPLDRTSLRWSLSHSPSRLLAKDQDFCYLEIMKPYGTADGRRGWARVSHSIKHKACPEFGNAQGLDVNRAELFYCGLFFEETDALGVLNATMFYSIKTTRPRRSRSLELCSSKARSAAPLVRTTVMWKPKDKTGCVFLVCPPTRKKIVLEPETGYNDLGSSDNSGSAVKTHSILETDQEGGLRDGSISSLNSDEHPKWFDDEGKPSLVLAQEKQQRHEPPQHRQEPRQQKPRRKNHHYSSTNHSSRSLITENSPSKPRPQLAAQNTFFLPTDHEEQQRRRCNTRVSTRRPAKALDEDFIARRRSRTTGNSRLSSRAKPTGCAPGTRPSRPKESPITFDTPIEEPMDFAPVGSQVGLNLEELNWRMRRYTTNAIPVQPMDWTDQGVRASARCHTVDGTRKHERYQHPSRLSARPSAPAFTPAMMDFTKTPSMRYSKQNPCDLSYLASFK
ncbi:START-like domain [Phytophthora cactorum]|nr:START-like domain [Phytophthora cactorum]